MRAGLTASAVLHAALIAYGLAWLEVPRPPDADTIEAIPVSFVEIAPETSLPKAAPPPAPRPLPSLPDLPLLPDLPPLPTVEATPPPPLPEPAPSPPQVAAVQPEPPAPKPALDADALAALAAPPAPPAPSVRPAVPKPPPKPAEVPFDIDRITAVLDRVQPAPPPTPPGGSQAPEATASIGDLIGAGQPRMTLSEIEALRSRLAGCWTPPVGWSDPAEVRVVLVISLNRDGSVASPPEVVEAPAGRYQQAAAESARRAVYLCAPYNLSAAKYEDWREVKMTFDPTDMGGRG